MERNVEDQAKAEVESKSTKPHAACFNSAMRMSLHRSKGIDCHACDPIPGSSRHGRH